MELIYQAIVHYNYKNILVTAPSNVAVDNILSRLVQMNQSKSKGIGRSSKKSSTSSLYHRKLRMLRIGHPARIQNDIQQYSLDALVQSADGTEIVQEVRKELQSHMNTLQQASAKGSSKRSSYINRRLLYQEMKTLRKEIRIREEKIVKELIDQAQVVFTTCVGAATLLTPKSQKSQPTTGGNDAVSTSSPIRQFDIVIIDEAAQSIEAACWIPVLLASSKVILAGDHLQLPPTITTNNANIQKALQLTMFERLMQLYNPNKTKLETSNTVHQEHPISRMLRVQYRMNERIANWASQALYNNALQTHASVQHHTLIDLDDVVCKNNDAISNDTDILHMPLLFIDTADCDMHESTNPSGSRYNHGEAQVVLTHVQQLLSAGVKPEQIAVITPYNGQVELLKSILLSEVASTLQIRSVDGFQGGEREAVIISLVRSSPKGGIDGIGFLSDNRRLNVAITRAKRHCCVIGDSDTVRQSPLIRNFIEWVEQYGEQRSAFEIISDHSPNASDMAEAERMMQQLMDSTDSTTGNHPIKREKPGKNKSDSADVELRRQMLYNKVQMFVSQKKAGDEMILASELTKLDRKLVHEIAEEFGLEHLSDGVDGVDRRITIRIPNDTAPSITVPVPVNDTPVDNNIENELSDDCSQQEADAVVDNILGDDSHAVTTPYTELESAEDDTDNVSDTNATILPSAADEEQNVGLNSVLGSLARERAEREKLRQQTLVNDKKKKSKGKKLGGTRPPPLRPTPVAALPVTPASVVVDDDDDMAFLDAQIDAVQNSHGRNVIGSGKEYRSIINGVLIAKPIPKPSVNANKGVKSSALNAKLKAAQESRKIQTKKK